MPLYQYIAKISGKPTDKPGTLRAMKKGKEGSRI